MTSYRKQNYRCHSYKRQSVERDSPVSFEREELLKDMLLERVSLRAIARLLKVSLSWVVKRAKECWQLASETLPTEELNDPELSHYCVEADEMWAFVGAKDCPEWVWPP